jgi:hypothetical protein
MPSLDKKVHGPEFFQNLAAEESDLMQNADEISKTLTPVINEGWLLRHLANGQGFQGPATRTIRLIGVFETAGFGIVALLERATGAAALLR